MVFEELDATTRSYMLREFEDEEVSGNPCRGKALSPLGCAEWPDIVREAIRYGNETDIFEAVNRADFWEDSEEYHKRDGTVGRRRVNVRQAAERLACSEFNTWYVRGLAARLLDEGVETCQVYRAADPRWEPAECSKHEGDILNVREVYEGHRARYWPPPGDPSAVSVPFQPGCHRTIRRV